MRDTEKLQAMIDLLADDVGRLRRVIPPGSSTWHTLDRFADNLETLDVMVAPCAGELVAWYAPGDPDAAAEAVAIVERRRGRLRSRLGSDQARERAFEAQREAEAEAA